MVDVSALRREYSTRPFDEGDLAATWWDQFERWFTDAKALGEPNAVVLATAGADGMPRARTVLMKSYDPDGFTWASNYDSRKGLDLEANGLAGICFPWHDLQRQVQAEGTVERLTAADSDAIWAKRPRQSQVSAVASAQSQVVASRQELTEKVARLDGQLDEQIARPAHWGGFRLRPHAVEFWQGRKDRLHDRLRFRLTGSEASDPAAWTVERLSP